MIDNNDSLPTFDREYMNALIWDDLEVKVCLEEIDRLQADNKQWKQDSDRFKRDIWRLREEIVAKDAKIKELWEMRLEKATFSVLLRSMTEFIDSKPMHSDNRKKVLILKV